MIDKGKKIVVKRIDYIDYLRGWAVLLMIFWHSIDALLSNDYQKLASFDFAKFIGGLVAPGFLFTAGAAFAIIISKRKEDLLHYRKPAVKQLGRIIQIFIIAYLLHFPFNNLLGPKFFLTNDQYLNFIKVDILHVIALGLFIQQIIFITVRKEYYFNISIILLSIIIIIVTPIIYQMDFLKIFPIEIATFFNKKYFSLFPLFPWLAYLFMGCFIMGQILRYSSIGKEDKIIKILLISGVILILSGTIPELFSVKSTPYYNFWLTSPNIFMIRMGIVLVSIYLLRLFGNKFGYKMRIFSIFGFESLFVYVVHLLIVYGSDSPITLSHYFGNKLGWIEYSAVYIALILSMLIAAKGWKKFKTKFKDLKLKKLSDIQDN